MTEDRKKMKLKGCWLQLMLGKKSEETTVSSIVINFTLLSIILVLFIFPPFAPLLVQNTLKIKGDAHASIKVKITNLAKKTKTKQLQCCVSMSRGNKVREKKLRDIQHVLHNSDKMERFSHIHWYMHACICAETERKSRFRKSNRKLLSHPL